MPNIISHLLPPVWVNILISAGLWAIIASGVYFSSAAGSISVAHAAFAGIGGYTAAILTTNFHYPYVVAILAGGVLGFLSGALLGWLSMRMHPLVAGLTTMAFAEIMVVVAFNIDYLGGANSFTGIPLKTNLELVYLVLAVVLLCAWRFQYSRLGYAAYATRDSMHAASVMGINVVWVKVIVFAIGGAVAAIGGALHAHYILVQNPNDMGFWHGIALLFYWLLGGSYSFYGATVGALVLTIIPELLRFSVYERFIIYGLIFATIVILRPIGLVPRIPLRFGKRPPLPSSGH